MAIAIAVAVTRRAGCSTPKCSRWRSAARSSIEYGANAPDGTWDWGFDLPLHLSDVVAMFAPIALWTRKPLLVEILYFWALTASLQAVLTPDLNQTFPSVFFFTYFSPTAARSWRRACSCSATGSVAAGSGPARVHRHAAMAAVAGTANVITGGNYMYLRAKPSQASLLDQMGPWPLYIATAAALALVLFALLALLARRVSHDLAP